MRITPMLLAVAVSVSAGGTRAAAQLSSIPILYEPFRATTGELSAGLVVGSGVNDGSSRDWSWGAVLQARVAKRFVVSGSGGVVYVDDLAGGSTGRGQFGGRLEIVLFESPVAVSGLGGVGYASLGSGESEVNVPLGIGFSASTTRLGPLVDLWAVPRYALRRIEAGPRAATQHGAGVSGGVGIGADRALGLGLGVDWSRLGQATDGEFVFAGVDRWIVGGWVRYRFLR